MSSLTSFLIADDGEVHLINFDRNNEMTKEAEQKDLAALYTLLSGNQLFSINMRVKPSLDQLFLSFDREVIEIRKRKESASVMLSHQAAIGATLEIKRLAINDNYIPNIKKKIELALEPFNDQSKSPPLNVQEFVSTLGIKALNNCQTQADILTKLDELNDFYPKIVSLLNISEKAEFYRGLLKNLKTSDEGIKKSLAQLQKDIDIQLYKLTKHNFSIDNMFEENQKLNVESLTKRMVALESQLAQKQTEEKRLRINGYDRIMDRLFAKQPCDTKLVVGIKNALKDYIMNTFTLANIVKEDHALSATRIRDMNQILDLFDGPVSEEVLLERLKTKVKTMKGSNRLSRLFDHSELCKKLDSAIKTYQIRMAPKTQPVHRP